MSELARRLIALNRQTKATSLDLGRCGLDAVPEEVGDLVWLEHLNLASSWFEHDPRRRHDGAPWVERHTQNRGDENDRLSDIAPLARLTRLQSLALAGARVTDLTPIAGLTELRTLDVSHTLIASLAWLPGLSRLKCLVASSTRVTSLPPLGALGIEALDLSDTAIDSVGALSGSTSLRALDVSDTPVSDLSPLAGALNLETLDAADSDVADVGPLGKLRELRTLDLSGTRVRDVRALRGCAALETLDLSGTEVADLAPLRNLLVRELPLHWSSASWRSAGIYVEGCPLTNPPPEIIRQGSQAVLGYFRERERGAVDHLYEAKMLVLGEGSAGKTSLVRRMFFPDRPLPTEQETTKGIVIHRHEFPLRNGRRFRLNVWDFGGQEIYHATHQFFLTRRSLYVLLDDTRSSDKSVSDGGFKYWLEVIDLFGGHSPVLIFQNEKGGRSKAIDIAGIKGRYDNVVDSYAGDLAHPGAADRLREAIEFHAANLGHIGEELPASWIQVRADIEARADQVPHITQAEYFEIYARHLEPDRTKALQLSGYLHDLGVFLHFQDDPLLARTVILQNAWATEAVFRILDDEVVKRQRGRFTRGDCAWLWRDSVYADMHPELLALMQRFELCYPLADSQPETWLAPQLLSPARPAALSGWARPGDLVLRYRYTFLPKGVLSRLTVRLHRFVRDPEMAWITGVLFERDSTAVLAELLPSGDEIELRARGPERKALLSVIAADLDALNDSFRGLRDRVDKWIPCICGRCSTGSAPAEFFAQKHLIKRKEAGRLKVECPGSFEEVDVLALLDGMRLEEHPAWAQDKARAPANRCLKIFLASSAELAKDRDDLDLYLRQQNDTFMKSGLYMEVVRWENFFDAMSPTRMQDEYNGALESCDVVVCLFHTKAGKFTVEELEVAHRSFQQRGRPYIYTFFKRAPVDPSSARREDWTSLWDLQDKLRALGHFYTSYDGVEHLKRQLRDQLDKLLARQLAV